MVTGFKDFRDIVWYQLYGEYWYDLNPKVWDTVFDQICIQVYGQVNGQIADIIFRELHEKEHRKGA